MDITVKTIDAQSPYLSQVIDLADRNSDTLGFLPHNAFIESAKNGNIIIAVTNGKFIGYLLYRIVKTKSRASITHLCVDESYRKSGVGRLLVEHLIGQTKEWQGISLYCRRDYEANTFWAHMGFQFIGEKLGRGKDQLPLTFYWYDHGQPSLFKLVGETAIQSKQYHAVLDMNVFIALYENPEHPFHANWVDEYLALSITPELCNEINRDDDRHRRLGMLDYSNTFPMVAENKVKVDQIYEILRAHILSPSLTKQDQSDLRQLSYAIAADAHFFVTKDKQKILGLKGPIYTEFGISIVSDADLIIHFDQMLNTAAYQSNRFAGSLLHISRVTSGQSELLSSIFHRLNKSKKGPFQDRLINYLACPQSCETLTINTQEGEPEALLVLSTRSPGTLEIPLIQVLPGPLSPILESRLLFWAVSRAVEKGITWVRITDRDISDEMKVALEENSFMRIGDVWEKLNLIGCHDLSEIDNDLCILRNQDARHTAILSNIAAVITKVQGTNDIQGLLNLEKLLWPLKLSTLCIPNYVVPIRAKWAMDLFDDALGSQTLFGSDPSLILRMENVYYRSSHTKLPQAPSRVLWYVSKGKSSQLSGVMSIRACSYVDEVLVDTPKELFKRFKKLGVYRWRDVLNAAGDNPKQEILAFRFSRTEVFHSPIPLSRFMLLCGDNSAPQAPRRIENELFSKVYEEGTRDLGR